jgi:hypothetical protein
MKTFVALCCALLACSGKLYLFPPRPNMPPPGIPRGAWNLCFDNISGVLEDARQASHGTAFADQREWECAQSYLLEACGKWLAKSGALTEMWAPGEVPYNFTLFRDHMRSYGERCEEEGYDTDFVRGVVKAFRDSVEAGALACPVDCPVPKN